MFPRNKERVENTLGCFNILLIEFADIHIIFESFQFTRFFVKKYDVTKSALFSEKMIQKSREN